MARAIATVIEMRRLDIRLRPANDLVRGALAAVLVSR